MNNRAYLLRYHEVALKGANRSWFEERLAINARKMVLRALGKAAPVDVSREHGRIIIQMGEEPSPSTQIAIEEALGRVFGATGISPIRIVPTNKEEILKASLEEFRILVEKQGVPASFRVLTRRSDKALPETSIEIDHFVGGEIQDAYPEMKVDLEDPEAVLGIEIRFDHSFIWTRKIKGAGGLPVGTNGRLLALISGGLDSPVAAIRCLRRGSPVSFVHFYGTPFVGEEVLQKVEDLVRVVNRYQPNPEPLHVVPFGKLQEKIALVTNPKIRTILYRRMMVRIACELAKRLEAHALVTGESLGQVASQTLENLVTINSVAAIPILRPLIAFDKDEIIAEAKHYGSYETAIRPGVDCCTLFADRHPALRTTPALVEEQEKAFNPMEFVQEAVRSIEERWIR